MAKPKLLILSHVLPFPRSSGQQQRVFYTLQAARKQFHVTFATSVAADGKSEMREKLSGMCDDVMLLTSQYPQHAPGKAWQKAVGTLYSLTTGLKYSNYVIGQLEFSPTRVASLLESNDFDCVLYEYWHAEESVSVFRQRGIPCILDMHNILWRVYQRDLNGNLQRGQLWKRRRLEKYKQQEEQAWKKFDGLITINREEHKYVEASTSKSRHLFYAPMGTDLSLWPYSWNPVEPLRLAYYGGLGTRHNQRQAMRCYERIMPEVWRHFPDAELWLVGSNPPDFLQALTSDVRIKVTGFVEDVQKLLAGMSVVICPWVGTYGFRSRLIEVMSIGVPLVASPDAVYGMDLEHGRELLLGESNEELISQVLRLLGDNALAQEQSRLARQSVEQLYSIDGTYDRLMCELSEWLQLGQRKIA
jgi:polysaccharide biosynthesis protein PslH